MKSDDPEIEAVRAEEERRGKRPIDAPALKRRFILRQKFKEALESNDVERFKAAIINVLGQMPGTPEYENSLRIWREFHCAS